MTVQHYADAQRVPARSRKRHGSHETRLQFEHLSSKKAKCLEGLGRLDGHVDQLKLMIQERINGNYIYSMTQDDTHDISRFNIMIEARPADTGRWFRALVGLEYNPEEKRLRLITVT